MSNWFTDTLSKFFYTEDEQKSFAQNAVLFWGHVERLAPTATPAEYDELFRQGVSVYGPPGDSEADTLRKARLKYAQTLSNATAQGLADAPAEISKTWSGIGANVWKALPPWLVWVGGIALALWVLSILANLATAYSTAKKGGA